MEGSARRDEQAIDDLAVAVVGMAGRFPGARDLDEYWANLRAGACSVTWLDKEALRSAGESPALLDDERYVPAAYLIEKYDRFDAEFFGYSPREAELLDPQHRVFLECAWSACEDAGLVPSAWDGIVGVWAGAGNNTYLTRHVISRPDLVSAAGEKQVLLGNRADYLTSRVAYKLDLRGPAVTVQTACSTSLVAIANACQSLLAFECDAALAGGVAVDPDRHDGYLFQEDGILSSDGLTRTLDRRASGTVGGDGVGVVVLKRLADALTDGDDVRAVIRGFAVNNDGANRAGFSAPSAESQAAAIRMAMNAADVGPGDIQYVELHGTATNLGDPIEMAALGAAFVGAAAESTYVGAVKANIGHLDAAAGVAGLIKTVLALQHGEIPPLVHFEDPNPRLRLGGGPFRVATAVVPWPSRTEPRRAGVSSFGLGGTNVHVVLEQAPPRAEQPEPLAREQLLVWSGRTESDVERLTRRLQVALAHNPGLELRDVAQTMQHGRRHLPHRRALVAADSADAADALEFDEGRILQGGEGRPDHPRPVAFLIGGFGAERAGMAAELYAEEPVFRAVVDRCADIVDALGVDVRPYLLDEEDDGVDHPIHRPSTGHPAVFTFELALIRLWESWGVVPDAMAGHSLGEYVAAHLAGVFGLENALKLVVCRAKLLEEHAAGAMIAVNVPEAGVVDHLGDGVSVAAVNDSFSCVLAVSLGAVDRLSRELDKRGVVSQRLASPYAFHSPLVDGALEEYGRALEGVTMSPPTIPFVSNLTATWIAEHEATDPAYWLRHMREPVRFADSVGELWSVPEVVMVEIGLGQTLTAGAMQNPARRDSRDGTVVASVPGAALGSSSTRSSLLRAAGRLWLAGVEGPFPTDVAARRVRLPTYPFQGPRYWVDAAASPDTSAADGMRRAGPESWFYTSDWWQVPIPPDDAGGSTGHWLLFEGSEPWCVELARRLRSSGRSVTSIRAGDTWAESTDGFSVDPTDPLHLDRLVKTLAARGPAPERIVFTWSTRADLFHSLVGWAQASLRWLESQPQRWDVVTAGALPLAHHDALVPELATVGGFCRVLTQEYPGVTSVHLDLSEREVRREDLVDRLVSELLAIPEQAEVALSSGRRWTRGYRRQQARDELATRVRPRGRYVVTGGLGRIGRIAALVLAEQHPVHLLLLTRSDVGSLPAELAALAADGTTVDVRTVDVADAPQVRDAIDEMVTTYGGIDGVVHCAGVTGAAAHASIPDITPGDLEDQLGPKLRGAENLRAALDGHHLDFALLCSSVSSVLGGLEFATYAAANVALDAFASRWWRPSQPWCSVAWEGWAFPTTAGDPDPRLGAAGKDFALSPDEGAEVLRRLLRGERADRVVISTGDLDDRLRTWRAPMAADAPTTTHERPHLHTPFIAPSSAAEGAVGQVWSRILGLSTVGVNDSFFELGGTSLLGLQVVHQLRSDLAMSLPLSSIYEAPTVRTLAALVDALKEGGPA